MTTTPLVVDAGVLEIASVDYSDAITKVNLLATANEITVPQTLATPQSSRKGATKYSIAIDYLSNDIAGELFDAFFAAIAPGETGNLDFLVRLRAGVVSASNPEWTGTLVVLSAAVGGEVGGLSSDSVTLPLVGAPVKATS